MFLLVYWRIPITKELTDTIAADAQNIEESSLFIKKEIMF